MLYNRDGSEYSAIGEEGELCLNALKQIVNAARSSNETKISSNIDIKSNNSKWEIDNDIPNFSQIPWYVNSRITFE